MKKNYNFQTSKRLFQYSAAAAVVLTGSQGVQSQVQYSDIEPDTTISNGSFTLDLNNDEVNDFTFVHNTQTSPFFQKELELSFLNTANGIIASAPGYIEGLVLNQGTMIGSSHASWRTNPASDPLLARNVMSFMYAGNWNGEDQKFLGLNVDVGGQKFYGWVRMTVASGVHTFTIHDYAFEQTAGDGITAGDTGTVTQIVDSEIEEGITIYRKSSSVISLHKEEHVYLTCMSLLNSIH